jgi:hypothetical protein
MFACNVDFRIQVSLIVLLSLVPMVTIIVGGKIDTIYNIYNDLREGIPVIIIDVSHFCRTSILLKLFCRTKAVLRISSKNG